MFKSKQVPPQYTLYLQIKRIYWNGKQGGEFFQPISGQTTPFIKPELINLCKPLFKLWFVAAHNIEEVFLDKIR